LNAVIFYLYRCLGNKMNLKAFQSLARRGIILCLLLVSMSSVQAMEYRVGISGGPAVNYMMGTYVDKASSWLEEYLGGASVGTLPGLAGRGEILLEMISDDVDWLGLDCGINFGSRAGGFGNGSGAYWYSGFGIGADVLVTGFLPVGPVKLTGGLGGGLTFLPGGLDEMYSLYGIESHRAMGGSAPAFFSAIAELGCEYPLDMRFAFVKSMGIRATFRAEYGTSVIDTDAYGGGLNILDLALRLTLWARVSGD
jgi:hypothetical protein